MKDSDTPPTEAADLRQRSPRPAIRPPDLGLQVESARYGDPDRLTVIATVLGRTVTLPIDDPLIAKHVQSGGPIDDPETSTGGKAQ